MGLRAPRLNSILSIRIPCLSSHSHTSPRTSPSSAVGVPIADSKVSQKDGANQDQNEEAFSANQAVVSKPNGTEKPVAGSPNEVAQDGPEESIGPKEPAADNIEMPDAPKSPAPVVGKEATDAPAGSKANEAAPSAAAPIVSQPAADSLASSSISPPPKEDVEMGEAQSQPELPVAVERAESTQETAISDVLAATPEDDEAVSPTNITAGPLRVSPAPPATADTSLSEPSQPAKVSREREIDSEDEPVAKRAKVETTADEVKVKTGAEPDPMDLDLTPQIASSSRDGAGNPNHLADPALDNRPITDFMSRQLRAILAGVKKTKAGHNFRSSVQELWPALWNDYSSRISNPIDISMMEKKLRGDLPKYSTMAEFKADIRLLVQNSVTFNGEEHTVTQLAKQLHKQILERMAGQSSVESRKPEKKEPAKQHPTRHTEPRATAQQPPPASSPPRRPPKPQVEPPAKPPVESPAFAIPANNNGVPLIRRDSTKTDGRAKRPVKPAHPKDLVYDTKRKKKLSPELRFCEEVLAEIRKSKYYDWNAAFLSPVDPVALNIPSYHKVVKKPMDLQTMWNKMSAGEYASAKEFEKDFDLIVKNCRLFNGEGHVVYTQALKLQDLFRKEFSKKDDWMVKHAPATTAAPSQTTTSPAPKDDSEEEDQESEAEPEVDEEQKATQHRLATIQKRLEEEQRKVNDMINTGTAEMADVEIAQSVVAMLQKQLMGERSKLAQLQKKPAKAKPVKSKKATSGGGGGSKKNAGGAPAGPSKRAGGTKKAAKRKMGALEKEVIASGIAELESPILERAIEIIKKDTGQGENDSGELELDIEQLSDEALVRLYDLVLKAFPDLRKEKEKTFAAPPPPPPAPKAKAAAKNKKNKPMSKMEQERRIQQLNELRAQAGRQASGSQEPIESIEGPGHSRASLDPVAKPNADTDDEESSEEE